MNQLKNNQGITLAEMVLAVIISSAVTLGLFYSFAEINIYHRAEQFYEDVAHYGNNVLDNIAYEMKKGKEISFSVQNGHRYIRIKRTRGDQVVYRVLHNGAIHMRETDEDEKAIFPLDSYADNTIDIKIKNFWCDPIPGDPQNPSTSYNKLRESIYDLALDITVLSMHGENRVERDFSFTRRVFAPNRYISIR